jgi:Na+-transporting NADH:ubiquinone oxidoreductase subunit NqrC
MFKPVYGHFQKKSCIIAKGDPAINIIRGAGKGYDANEFIESLQGMGITPHVAQNSRRRQIGNENFKMRNEGPKNKRSPSGLCACAGYISAAC